MRHSSSEALVLPCFSLHSFPHVFEASPWYPLLLLSFCILAPSIFFLLLSCSFLSPFCLHSFSILSPFFLHPVSTLSPFFLGSFFISILYLSVTTPLCPGGVNSAPEAIPHQQAWWLQSQGSLSPPRGSRPQTPDHSTLGPNTCVWTICTTHTHTYIYAHSIGEEARQGVSIVKIDRLRESTPGIYRTAMRRGDMKT